MSKKPNLTPLGGNILVRGVEEETKTTSGIVLPETIQKEKKQKGLVITLGTGKLDKDGKKIAFNVKPGDTVIFKKYSPEEIEVDGESYFIMSEEDILAVLGK